MRIFLWAIIVVTLAGLLSITGCTKNVRPAKREPALAQCNAICYQPCTKENGDTETFWDGVPNDPIAWDKLAGETLPLLANKLRVCEQSRKACAQCLDRLEKEGVIKQ